MKRNTLHIEYKTNDKAELPTESMRCTSYEGAKNILSKRVRFNIKRARYTDEIRTEHILIGKR